MILQSEFAMLSTVDWKEDMSLSTLFQSENYSSGNTTTSAKLRGFPMINGFTEYKIATAAMSLLGILTNGFVLFGFYIAGRSKMNASAAYIVNHTILEHPIYGDIVLTLH